MVMCYTYRSIPALDRRKITALRKIFYAVIVENERHGLGKETNFDFKYVPSFHLTTEMGEMEASGWKEPGIERRNLRTLVIASTAVGVFTWLGVKVVVGAFQMVFRQ